MGANGEKNNCITTNGLNPGGANPVSLSNLITPLVSHGWDVVPSVIRFKDAIAYIAGDFVDGVVRDSSHVKVAFCVTFPRCLTAENGKADQIRVLKEANKGHI